MISQDLLDFFSVASIASAIIVVIIYILFLRKKWGEKVLTPLVIAGIIATIIVGIIAISLYRRG